MVWCNCPTTHPTLTSSAVWKMCPLPDEVATNVRFSLKHPKLPQSRFIQELASNNVSKVDSLTEGFWEAPGFLEASGPTFAPEKFCGGSSFAMHPWGSTSGPQLFVTGLFGEFSGLHPGYRQTCRTKLNCESSGLLGCRLKR